MPCSTKDKTENHTFKYLTKTYPIIHPTWLVRCILLALLVPPVLFWQPFLQHFKAYLTGGAITNVIVGEWHIVLGWIQVYRAARRNRLATTGLYAASRHPQYLGFLLLMLGWFIGWPTLLSLVFVPILIYKYLVVAKKEEKELRDTPGWNTYAAKTPFLV